MCLCACFCYKFSFTENKHQNLWILMMLLKSSLCFMLTAKESTPHIKMVDVNT